MVKNCLGIDAASGGNKTHRRQARSEFIECAKICRRSQKYVDKCQASFIAPVQSAKERCAFDFDVDCNLASCDLTL